MKVNVSFPIYQTIDFWICVGLFLYFTGSFFFLLLISNVDRSDAALTQQMKIIYNVVTIIKNLMLGCALIVKEDNSNETGDLKIPDEIDLGNFVPNNKLN